MTCGTLMEFCSDDFGIPPRLPPPPPILSYYFEDNKLNSSFYCEFCSNLEASLDPLQKELEGSSGGLLSPATQNLTVILFIVAAISAAVGSAVTLVWRKWFRCRDGGFLSKAFGTSHSSNSADISGSPDGRRRSSRTTSLGSSSALQNLQKRLSSSSFISRRSVYQHHPTNIISSHNGSHFRSGNMSNNTYCECPSSMMMMMCSTADGGGNNLNHSDVGGSGIATTTSLSPSCLASTASPSAPTASTLSISSAGGGNVYAELDPVSVHQQLSSLPPLPSYPPPGGIPFINGAPVSSPLSLIGSTPSANQYVLNHRRRQPAPLPPIPASVVDNGNDCSSQHPQNDLSVSNVSSCGGGMPIVVVPTQSMVIGMNQGGIVPGVMPAVQMQMEMNDLNDIYYSDLDCKHVQF